MPLPLIIGIARPIQTYIVRRFAKLSTECPVLDGLAMSDALLLAKYLGSSTEHIRIPAPIEEMEQTLALADAGLEIANRGIVAVEERPRNIATMMNPNFACEVGLSRLFKRLITRFDNNHQPQTFAVREMIVKIGLEQKLFSFDQTDALGIPLPERNAESIESARRRFGISDRNTARHS